MNENKAQKFVIKLMDMTCQEEIEWHILEHDPESLPSRLPFRAKLVGYAYETSIDTNSFVLFRCQLPIFDEEITPIGWNDDLTYFLQIFDVHGKFIDEISKTVALEDLYDEVQNLIHSVDKIIDSILSR
jgi:hypothetical protein